MKNNEHHQDITTRIPLTEEEGFKILDEVMPLDDKAFAIQGTKEEFVTSEHFELGMWIRNVNSNFVSADFGKISFSSFRKLRFSRFQKTLLS